MTLPVKLTKASGMGAKFVLGSCRRLIKMKSPDDSFFASSSSPIPSAERRDYSNENNWAEPILFGQHQTPSLTAEMFPKWLRDYLEALAAQTQTPISLGVMLAMSVLATCLQKRYEVRPYGDDYAEPINVWTVTALPPGSRKTAVITALTAPLANWEKEQAELLRDDAAETESRRIIINKRIAKLQDKAAGTDDPVDREIFLAEICKIRKQLPAPIVLPRLWTGDVTPERLQGMLVEHGEKMSLLSDEGGIFEVMSGLYSDGKVNIDVFLQAHAGAAVRVDRGERTAYLQAPALTFGLAVQPAVIGELSSGSKRKIRAVGGLARFLYCVPESNIGKRNVASRLKIATEVRAAYETKISYLLGARRDGEAPKVLTLSPEALNRWVSFSQHIEGRQGSGGDLERIQDWSAKLPGAALRIAGLAQLSFDEDSVEVHAETLNAVLAFCTRLIPHALAAFDVMIDDSTIKDARFAFEWAMKSYERDETGAYYIRQTDLFRTGRFNKSKLERLLRTLDLLRERNILSGQQRIMLRTKQILVWYVHPVLIEDRDLYLRDDQLLLSSEFGELCESSLPLSQQVGREFGELSESSSCYSRNSPLSPTAGIQIESDTGQRPVWTVEYVRKMIAKYPNEQDLRRRIKEYLSQQATDGVTGDGWIAASLQVFENVMAQARKAELSQ
jgi:hypothetical protein